MDVNGKGKLPGMAVTSPQMNQKRSQTLCGNPLGGKIFTLLLGSKLV